MSSIPLVCAIIPEAFRGPQLHVLSGVRGIAASSALNLAHNTVTLARIHDCPETCRDGEEESPVKRAPAKSAEPPKSCSRPRSS